MSTPRTPLSNHVPWSRLASELGIHVRTMGLPAATHCPCCKGVLRVYRDPVLDGEWFHCPSCQRQGDMIELAAAVWELDIPATVSRLKRLGFGVPDSADDVAPYQRHHVEYRGRLQQLWNKALARLDESRTLIRLCHHLGMMCDPPRGTSRCWPGRDSSGQLRRDGRALLFPRRNEACRRKTAA